MKPLFSVFKSQDATSWVLHDSFETEGEARNYFILSKEVTSHQYWKIVEVWSWPF